MKRALLLCAVLLFAACDKKPQPAATEVVAPTEMPAMNDGFQRFLDQYPEISLPIKIKACEVKSDLVELDSVISGPFHESGYVYGKFSFGNKYIGVITLQAADCFLPILTTYSLNGKKIDSIQITIGGCDDGPCYTCVDTSEIHKDLTIYFADTMQTFECDEDYLPKGAPVTTTILYKEGKITATGRIEMSGEKKKQL